MSAADLAARLKLHRSRDEWRGACPCCGYPDAFVLGTGKSGRLMGWCASCEDAAGIARSLAEMQGGRQAPEHARPEDAAAKEAIAARKFERAMATWNGSEPVPGTIAERYLGVRGLPHLATSAALRFRLDCWHLSRGRLPALIAIVQAVDGGPLGIHQTYLKRDGSGKADIEPQRASLGPVRGGAIRLDPIATELVIGEGIETAASAGLLLKLPAWSARAAGNMANALMLPASVTSVVIAADRGEPGRLAANTAWRRWKDEGRRVRIYTPNSADDFNDVLRSRLASRSP
jgi:putative DNA primase/helicase